MLSSGSRPAIIYMGFLAQGYRLMWDQFILTLNIASTTICLFAIAFSLTQVRYQKTYRRLALIFLAVLIATIPELESQDGTKALILLSRAISLVSFCAAFLIFPLLYEYILRITTEGPPENTTLNRWHYFLFYIAIVASILIFFLPTDLETALLSIEMGGRLIYIYGTIILLIVLQLLTVIQWLIYTQLSSRVLKKFARRARDLFSNEEYRDLRWITWIIRAQMLYVILAFIDQIAEHFLDVTTFPHDYEVIYHLCLIVALGLWGLRQTPRLRGPQRTPSNPAKAKYANSALAPADQARIAQKLTLAMTKDHAYRDPDLSLAQLAEKTGITAHYISQTLNEHIGASFFDHVNHWRIEDAKKLLLESEKTVLAIAYEAGFNTRSAFYRAFSKHAGQTPTTFRLAHKK